MSSSKNFTIIRNNCAYSLLEVTMVVVIVVVLASLAFAKFIFVIERAKAVEAVNVLRRVKNLQNQNKEINGYYVGNGNIEDFPELMFKAPDLQHFDRIIVYQDPLKVCEIYRKDRSYRLHILDTGDIVCTVDEGSENLCNRLGFE